MVFSLTIVESRILGGHDAFGAACSYCVVFALFQLGEHGALVVARFKLGAGGAHVLVEAVCTGQEGRVYLRLLFGLGGYCVGLCCVTQWPWVIIFFPDYDPFNEQFRSIFGRCLLHVRLFFAVFLA